MFSEDRQGGWLLIEFGLVAPRYLGRLLWSAGWLRLGWDRSRAKLGGMAAFTRDILGRFTRVRSESICLTWMMLRVYLEDYKYIGLSFTGCRYDLRMCTGSL